MKRILLILAMALSLTATKQGYAEDIDGLNFSFPQQENWSIESDTRLMGQHIQVYFPSEGEEIDEVYEMVVCGRISQPIRAISVDMAAEIFVKILEQSFEGDRTSLCFINWHEDDGLFAFEAFDSREKKALGWGRIFITEKNTLYALIYGTEKIEESEQLKEKWLPIIKEAKVL